MQLDDGSLRQLVLEEVHDIMGVTGAPVFSKICRWEKAIPQYNLGYQTVLDAIGRLEMQVPGLYLCSNYRGGIAVGDCVMNGKITAERIAGVSPRA